jgi:hypothetical protein
VNNEVHPISNPHVYEARGGFENRIHWKSIDLHLLSVHPVADATDIGRQPLDPLKFHAMLPRPVLKKADDICLFIRHRWNWCN